MRKIIITAMTIMVLLGFVACDSGSDYLSLEEIDGSELQELINNAEEGATIYLEKAIYKLSDPLVIDKPITIIGAMIGTTRASIIDYSGQLFDISDYEDEPESIVHASWLGGVNIYSDGVTLENVKIIGDLDRAREKGAISDTYFTENAQTNYKPVFGLYINPLDDPDKHQPTEPSTTAGINVRNVEITNTTYDAVYVTHVRVKADWYSSKLQDYQGMLDSDAKGIVFSGMYIHDNGDIETTKVGANGMFLRNSTMVTVEDSYIDTGNSGAPIWIHSSEYLGPYIINNTELHGTYKDSEDRYLCYKDETDKGAFEELAAPIIMEVNGGYETTVGSLITSMDGADPIQIENYGLASEATIDLKSIPQRKPYWGNYIVAFSEGWNPAE